MSPSSSQSSGELWGFPLMPNAVTVDVLLPNGLFLSVKTARECALSDFKTKVWVLAKELPLFEKLKFQSNYIFVGVTNDAKLEEFYNESQRLCDIHLFQPIMKLVTAAEENREEKILNQNIAHAIGLPVNEFDKIKSIEVEEFRKHISLFCKRTVEQRNAKKDSHSILLHNYPPRLEINAKLPLHTAENLFCNNTIVIRVWTIIKDSFQTHASVRIAFDATSFNVIQELLKKKSMSFIRPSNITDAELFNHFVLKICGKNEYLIGNYPICQYKYIRQCINRGETPDLMLETISNVLTSTPVYEPYIQPKAIKLASVHPMHSKFSQSSTISKLFKLRVNFGSYLNVAESLYVLANIYHGNKPLCCSQTTKELTGSGAPKWKQWLEFNIKIKDLPRGAKICLSVCGVRKKKDEHWPLAWVNIPVYDFKGYLHQGKLTVRLWYPPCQMEGFLYPLGISGSNPCKETPSLELEFDSFVSVVKYVNEICNGTYDIVAAKPLENKSDKTIALDDPEAVKFESLSQLVAKITQRDPLSPLTKKERNLLWEMRKYCCRIPESLPKLLQAVEWQRHDYVQEMYEMLKTWTILKPEIALELLDSKYPDLEVRKFATSCLDQGLTDDGLLKYLLQLVTALKFEAYYDSSLVRFLLSRAISNLRIGHFLFWHLKSEMHDGQVSLRFGLILEAYCRTCGAYLLQLVRQVAIVEKLVNVSTTLQKDDAVSQKVLKEHLLKPDYEELLKDNISPLNPACRLGSLCMDFCEVKSSAKRPLILQWYNSDPLSEHFQPLLGILFKNGDDLRQDMLTLQILRVMDDIWQKDDLDLCISPYICISMGQNVGMIEFVQNAETIMSVQKKGGVVGSLQLRNGTLHQWLKETNPGDKQYQKAIENFTKSCAGYCVATLVLGIADRHNDNIMIKKNGQMFHIDFGHFLNHRKKKYGICRNRVPFVLPDDFIRVICLGLSDYSRSVQFKKFEALCCQAYMSIRQQANVIINLLCMMLGAGLPELSSFEDIEYVRSSLALDKSSDEALQFFKTCMAAAQNKQWTTKVDWVCHAVRHSVLK